MDIEALKKARLAAEKAVADMPESPLKEKAFEVILNRLLQEQENEVRTHPAPSHKPSATRQVSSPAPTPSTLPERIRMIKNDGFFGPQRTMGEIRAELANRGWHYPKTALSGALQSLTQKRELRRLRVVDGKRKVWKYSNP